MSLRIKKQLGYAIYPEQGEESAIAYNRIANIVRNDPTTLPSSLEWYPSQTALFYREILGREYLTGSKPDYSTTPAKDVFLFDESNNTDVATASIYMLTPPGYLQEWRRNDDIIDYMNFTAHGNEPVATITALPYDIFPYSSLGYQDKNDGRSLETRDVDLLSWALEQKSEIPKSKIDTIAQKMGYGSAEEAQRSIAKMPPAEIYFMATMTELLNPDEIRLLRPVLYTFWT